MVSHMKTTIQLSDAVLSQVRTLARREKTTVRSLVEEALRRLLKDRRGGGVYEFAETSVGGQGLQPGTREGDWVAIRERIYEGQGG